MVRPAVFVCASFLSFQAHLLANDTISPDDVVLGLMEEAHVVIEDNVKGGCWRDPALVGRDLVSMLAKRGIPATVTVNPKNSNEATMTAPYVVVEVVGRRSSVYGRGCIGGFKRSIETQNIVTLSDGVEWISHTSHRTEYGYLVTDGDPLDVLIIEGARQWLNEVLIVREEQMRSPEVARVRELFSIE